VAEKPHDAVVKFDTYVSKFKAASRGFPCDSTALVLHGSADFAPHQQANPNFKFGLCRFNIHLQSALPEPAITLDTRI